MMVMDDQKRQDVAQATIDRLRNFSEKIESGENIPCSSIVFDESGNPLRVHGEIVISGPNPDEEWFY